ncbi:MAG: glycosyltransferase family 4 protein [Parvibaculum sp.]|uniref:glycosyltransferase family 4 protein n=1 Tax=Parvibaculum sp. TaxID=2024848 RepID=UPI002ABA8716|nr:glycosyltransferase family 4 protein [Parvibaculum sp.]MDZ4379862.1 glycosyltransferase family 4 protein [Parvibaculum sp.]
MDRLPSTSPLHIVLVLPTYLPESFGGAEQQSRKFAATLVREGVKVTLLAPRIEADTPARETKDGVEIIRFRLTSLPNLGGRHFLSFASWSLRTAWWLRRHRRSYDVVHIIHGRLHAVGPLIGAKLAGRPALIKFGRGGYDFDIDTVQNKRLFGPQFAAIVKRLTTGFVANSAQMIVDVERHGIEKARVHRIPNGVIMPQLEPRAARERAESVFLFMGRFDREKAIDTMLKGIARLSGERAAKLILVGNGPREEELKALAQDLGIAARVEFTGRLDDVTPALRKADFYLSTSLSEGMSNSVLEAMSFGVVPVVTRVSGVEDMVEDGTNGYLFEAGDVSSCVEALERAAATPPERYARMSAAARETLAARFGMESVAAQHIALYRTLPGIRRAEKA